ncbi:unnamed protein product, partial [Medioppia subpectinata]
SNSLSKRRHIIAIESKVIGKKKTLIRLLENGGTVEEEVIDNNNCCISDEDLLQLGDIGLQGAKYLCFSRDSGGPESTRSGAQNQHVMVSVAPRRLHGTQPPGQEGIDNSYTDYEIMHELDSSHPTEFEIYSRAHWGENFPGASSWNCLQGFLANKSNFFREGLRNRTNIVEDYNPFFEVMGIQYNQLMFNLTSGAMNFFAGYPDSKQSQTAVLAMFGHQIDDKDVLHMFRMKKSEAIKPSLITNVRMFSEGLKYHGAVSMGSGIKNAILKAILQSASTNDSYMESDYNLMISSATNVISAEVPKMLSEIAKSIKDKQWFRQLSDEEALQVLTTGSDESSQKFRYFIERHGHRGYREVDPMYKPWKGNPMPCIKTIKTILSGNESQFEEKIEKSVHKVIDELKTPLNPLKKLLIKHALLPWAQRGIGYRELSKYFMIWMTNKLREGFWYLAQQMVNEGLIPNVDTFFYLTITEVEALCNGQRDPLIFS